jgi:hypothetical protein
MKTNLFKGSNSGVAAVYPNIAKVLAGQWNTDPGTHVVELNEGTVRVFRQEFTPRMSLSFTPLLHLKRCQACDQWHSSRVSTFLTSSQCKLRPNTEGTSSKTFTSLVKNKEWDDDLHGARFPTGFALEDAIGSHAYWG